MYNWQVGDEGTVERLKQTGVRFGGTGADGALNITSGTTTLDLGGASVFVKNYTSISITGTGKLAFSNPADCGTLIILKSQGNVTITSSTDPAIDLRLLGGKGGVGNGAKGDGWYGTGGYRTIGLAGKYDFNGNGGQGGGNLVEGTGGGSYAYTQTGSIGPRWCLEASRRNPTLKSKSCYDVYPGGGGSAGCSVGASGGTCHSGGRGGGALIIECLGALNFTGKINTAGGDGDGGGETGTHYGGGGGAGGSVLILYGTLTANTGTITLTGGAGGPAGTGLYPGAAGGAGSIGQSLIEAFYD